MTERFPHPAKIANGLRRWTWMRPAVDDLTVVDDPTAALFAHPD